MSRKANHKVWRTLNLDGQLHHQVHHDTTATTVTTVTTVTTAGSVVPLLHSEAGSVCHMFGCYLTASQRAFTFRSLTLGYRVVSADYGSL